MWSFPNRSFSLIYLHIYIFQYNYYQWNWQGTHSNIRDDMGRQDPIYCSAGVRCPMSGPCPAGLLPPVVCISQSGRHIRGPPHVHHTRHRIKLSPGRYHRYRFNFLWGYPGLIAKVLRRFNLMFAMTHHYTPSISLPRIDNKRM